MLNVFKIKLENFHWKINILGIRIKIPSLGIIIKKFRQNKNRTSLRPYRTFLYTNKQTLTKDQKACYMQNKFYKLVGYFPNLRNPKSFNEKLLWMELNYKEPKQTICIDKYEFKSYIKEVLGEGYTIPLLAVYDTVYDIDFNKLPNQFVLKTTNGGSGNYGIKIVRDKSLINEDFIKYLFNEWALEWWSIYYASLSEGFKDIKPRIIAEEYMEQIDGQLYDYKFFCFHGKAKCIYTAIDHFPGVKSKITFFDLNWKPLPVTYGEHPNIPREITPPRNLVKMIEIAEKLSAPFPFVRVDFYEIDDKIYVGEMTFTPGSGFGKYKPIDWDYKMGEWLNLNKLPKENVYLQEGFSVNE